MAILEYLKKTFRKKIARRITREYATRTDVFTLSQEGRVEFKNWDNPLVRPFEIKQGMVDFFKQFIRPGDLAIDIGANIGDTTVPMALAAGPEGTTLGFDPNPFVFKILLQNASLNRDKTNIHAHPFAITVEEEEFYFISSEASFANGGISKTKESIHGKYIQPGKIKGVNLKKFLEQQYPDQLKKLSFIKIDTEGYDKEIIRSISDLIDASRPVLIAEVFKKSSPQEKGELFDLIHGHHYDLFLFEDFDIRARVTPVNTREELSNFRKTVNIYALPRHDSRPVE